MDNGVLEKLLEDKNFRTKLDGLKSEDEIKALFAERGVAAEISEDDLSSDDELDEMALEDVAGGGNTYNFWKRIKWRNKSIKISITIEPNMHSGDGRSF